VFAELCNKPATECLSALRTGTDWSIRHLHRLDRAFPSHRLCAAPHTRCSGVIFALLHFLTLPARNGYARQSYSCPANLPGYLRNWLRLFSFCFLSFYAFSTSSWMGGPALRRFLSGVFRKNNDTKSFFSSFFSLGRSAQGGRDVPVMDWMHVCEFSCARALFIPHAQYPLVRF